ncbi:MAG: WD40 repeat domain-containing protein [Ideonella sp.]|nr:WD40 repeat domain-containing protein [Ideonella sp.]
MATAKRLRVGKSYQLRFVADGSRVIAIGRDIVQWSIEQGKRLCSAHPFKHSGSIDIAPTGDRVVIKNTSGQLAILSTQDLATIVQFPKSLSSEGHGPMFSPCGAMIIDGTLDGYLRLIDCSTSEVVHQEFSQGIVIQSLTGDSQRRLFAYVRQPKVPDPVSRLPFSHLVIRRWPWVGEPEVEVPIGESYVVAISLSPDGGRLASLQMNAAAAYTLKVIDLRSGCALADRGVDRGATNWSIAWSPDGTKLGCVEKGQVSVFDAASLERVARHVDAYPCWVEFSPDGTSIAMGSWQRGVVMPVSQLEPLV